MLNKVLLHKLPYLATRVRSTGLRNGMALLGNIGEFDEARETWPQYAKRLKHFLIANKVTSEQQKTSAFLSVIGPETFKLLESLLAPVNPEDKTFVELVEVLTEHHSPEPSEIMERGTSFSLS